MKLVELGLKEAARKLKAREVSSVELTTAVLERVQSRNSKLNAYITVTADKALDMARASDARLASGKAGLMDGVPVAIKDLFCTQGVQTTAGSRILEGFKPPYESTVTTKLWEQGSVMVGKTNMDEFAMGSSNETSYFGPARNPWDETRTPGGSSGGSSAAVSDYLCMGATGSDTGGSIRQPCALTGTVGIKPTYGRCSRYGMVAFASSLDQAGVMTRSVEDAALMLRVISGHDPLDSTSYKAPVEAYDEKLEGLPLKGLKIGLPKEYFIKELDPAVRAQVDAAVKRFTDQGAEAVEISLPHTSYSVPTYYIIAPAEAASNLARYDGMRYGLRVEGSNLVDTYRKSRSAGFGPEVKRRIMIGNYTLSSGYYDAFYTKAQKVRTLIAQDFRKAFEQVDFIFTPTAPSTAFKLGEKISDPIQMFLNDVFTTAASLAGLPGISVPAGLVNGLPVGLQILARPFDEQRLLQVAWAHEKMCGFKPRVAV
jgi:aspartyl-tRNA(Asn)/glutamyl-tRNA(Gln) amidotransferase subunit A